MAFESQKQYMALQNVSFDFFPICDSNKFHFLYEFGMMNKLYAP